MLMSAQRESEMAKRKPVKKSAKKVRRPVMTIVVDGVTYAIPKMMQDAPKEELERFIRGWQRQR
jgi:hypothetical protein